MTVRIGLVGAGGIAGGHVDALSKIEEAKLVAVADIDRPRAEDRARAAGAQVFTDFREMVDKVALDAIWLCTPPTVRAEPIELAISKKIPVFCEKPVSDKLPIALAVAEKVEKAKLPVMIGYVLRYMQITERVREYLARDTVTLANSYYCCPMSLDFRENKPVARWFFKKEISGGAIIDQATHLFDMMRYLMGDVDQMYSIGCNCTVPKCPEHTVEDSYAVAFRFRSGIPGVHSHTWGHYKWRSGITFYGEKGLYSLNFMDGQLRVEGPDGQTFLFQPQDAPMVSEDRLFVQMVARGDFSGLHSSYGDGTKTLEMTTRCLDVLNLPLSTRN
jgi:predicted dehydrogenase